MKNELWQLSACELADGIREKQFMAEEVLNEGIHIGILPEGTRTTTGDYQSRLVGRHTGPTGRRCDSDPPSGGR